MIALVAVCFLLHYLFASVTAHVTALAAEPGRSLTGRHVGAIPQRVVEERGAKVSGSGTMVL